MLFNIALFAFGFFQQHFLQPRIIGWIVKHHRLRRQIITSSTSRFLIVRFDTSWQVKMYYKTHVRFVDPHTKSNRCNHHLNVITLKGILYGFTLLNAHSCVIAHDRNVSRTQFFRNLFHFFAAIAIYNTTFAFLPRNKLGKLFHRLKFFLYGVANVWTVKTTQISMGFMQTQMQQNIRTSCWISCRCECHKRYIWESISQIA